MTDPRKLAEEVIERGVGAWTTQKEVFLATELLSALDALDAARKEQEPLPSDTVCACLSETGERRVRVYERCERCHALTDFECERCDELQAALDAARKERLEAEKHAYQEGVGVGYEDGGIDGVLQGERQGNPLVAEALAAGAKFQRIFRAIAEDASDGTYALFTDADLFNAEREFEAALSAEAMSADPTSPTVYEALRAERDNWRKLYGHAFNDADTLKAELEELRRRWDGLVVAADPSVMENR